MRQFEFVLERCYFQVRIFDLLMNEGKEKICKCKCMREKKEIMESVPHMLRKPGRSGPTVVPRYGPGGPISRTVLVTLRVAL